MKNQHMWYLTVVVQSICQGNFKMKNSVPFVKNLAFFITFLLLELPNKGLWEGKTDLLSELARIMLSESFLPKYFWVDVVSTTCYVMNQVLIRPILKKKTL